MKKIFITTLALMSLFAFNIDLSFAQNNQNSFPSAGITPESPFYFLDKFGEALRKFFTFDSESKARLQIAFAAERIAEIKVIFETKGIEAKSIEVAQSRLQSHLANAAKIVAKQKKKGRDVSALAKELDDKFEYSESVLKQSFKEKKEALKIEEKKLKTKISEARLAGDVTQTETLVKQLSQVKAQKELLKLKEEEQEKALEQEEEFIEEEMKAKEKAEKNIREVEKEKQELLDEAAEEDIVIPAGMFEEFDNLFSQAKSAFVAENFAEAKRLAKETEKVLDIIKEAVEGLEKIKEEEEKKEEFKEEEEQQQEELEAEEEIENTEEEIENITERLEKEEKILEEDFEDSEKMLENLREYRKEAGN